MKIDSQKSVKEIFLQRLGLAALLFLLPTAAIAHAPIEGLGNFMNGLVHPFLVPAHLLLVASFGLLLGKQGDTDEYIAFYSFLVAAILSLVTAWFNWPINIEIYILIAAVITSLLVVADFKVGLIVCVALAVIVGILVGLDSAQESLSGKAKMATLFGTAVGLYIMILYSSALSDHFKNKDWQKIGIRVISSWIAASSLIVLALSFSAKG